VAIASGLSEVERSTDLIAERKSEYNLVQFAADRQPQLAAGVKRMS